MKTLVKPEVSILKFLQNASVERTDDFLNHLVLVDYNTWIEVDHHEQTIIAREGVCEPTPRQAERILQLVNDHVREQEEESVRFEEDTIWGNRSELYNSASIYGGQY